MKIFLYLLLFYFLTTPLLAKSKDLEKLNFYPNAKAYGSFKIESHMAEIDTPQQEIYAKEVKNFGNAITTEYAHKLFNRLFLGASFTYESVSENALRYGVDLVSRNRSQGFKEPKLFLISRLLNQTEEHGLLDLYFSYSDSFGRHEVGKKGISQRFTGRNVLNLRLSHGREEDEWEFRTSLGFTYTGKGEDRYPETNSTYLTESLQQYDFKFSTQFKLSEKWLPYAGIGIVYRTDENIKQKEDSSNRREIQSGSGSAFNLGLKYTYSQWTLIQFEINLERSEYFIKGSDWNLDGRYKRGQSELKIVQAF